MCVFIALLTCIIINLIQAKSQAHSIDLYTDTLHEGNKTTVSVLNCTNLPTDFLNSVSSVNTHGRCVQFYDELDCAGNSIKIPTRSSYHHDLKYWNFNDKIQSVGMCTDPCIPDIRKMSPISTDTLPILINLYSKPDYKGKVIPIDVNKKCVPFKTLPRYTFSIDIQSVRLEKGNGNCVLALVGQDQKPSNCEVEDEFNVYEIREGIPFLNDFTKWGRISSERIKAFSPCQCKLAYRTENQTMKELQMTGSPERGISINELTLYSESNYKGASLKIPLNFTGCKGLSSGENYDWEGLAESMTLTKGACVVVHKSHNCSDSSSPQFISSVPNLSDYSFDFEIRSISICHLQVAEPENITLKYFTLIGFSLTCMLLSVFTVLLILRKISFKRHQQKVGMLSDKEIEEFIRGMGFEIGGENSNTSDVDSESLKFSSELLMQNQPYNNDLEIPKSILYIDTKFSLGSGDFGVVYKGSLTKRNTESNIENVIPVAVKTTKQYSNGQCLRAMLSEIKVMMYVGKHKNIIELIGCCTGNLHQGELFIVMEYCERGSLERYLKENRASFINKVKKGKLCLDNCQRLISEPISTSPKYLTVIPSLESQINSSPANTRMFDIQKLMEWSIEIAEAMEYLASKRVIHGDLSARNVLLKSDLTPKISDFGLSRKLYCYSQYTRNSEEPVPWRWLALESLKNLEFSTESDVWSYGILMWELFTLGEQPYPGVASLTNNFIVNLEQGFRPTIPPYSTSDCYNVMSSCWDEDKKRRPRFSTIAQSLREIKESNSRIMMSSNSITTVAL